MRRSAKKVSPAGASQPGRGLIVKCVSKRFYIVITAKAEKSAVLSWPSVRGPTLTTGGEFRPSLEDTLGHHRTRDFHEACHVGTAHVVDISVSFCAVFDTLLVDFSHDTLEFRIDLFRAPRKFL